MYYCELSLGVLQHILPRFLVTCAIWCVLDYSFRELLYWMQKVGIPRPSLQLRSISKQLIKLHIDISVDVHT